MRGDSLIQDFRISGFTFPYDERIPPGCDKSGHDPAVPCAVLLEFLLPELRIGLGRGGVAAAFMAMPEASVHEDDLPAAGENQVGVARKAAAAWLTSWSRSSYVKRRVSPSSPSHR